MYEEEYDAALSNADLPVDDGRHYIASTKRAHHPTHHGPIDTTSQDVYVIAGGERPSRIDLDSDR